MKLGRYELVEPIAKGGMAEIYRARLAGPAGFEQIFAVKRILPQYANNEDFRRLFINEAKVASLLRHPNIVSVLELGQEGDGLYLVMEFVDGVDLHKLLKKLKKQDRWLQPDLAAHIVVSLLRALAYAHSRTDSREQPLGIVHRDVTPHNTLITKQGLVKLADFGIAKAAFTTFKTAQGLTRGKLGYMSPEQIKGAKLTGASDMFTVGIMLLELLTGSLRTEGRSPKVLVKETMQGALAKHPGLKDAPVALGQLCRHLLAKEPDHRPTASEALQTLAASGWDRDRSMAMAAFVAGAFSAVQSATGRAPAPRTRASRQKPVIASEPPPVPPSRQVSARDATTNPEGPQPVPAAHPKRPVEGPVSNENPTGPPADGPTESMDELPTVLLNDPVAKPVGPAPPAPAGPPPRAATPAGPRSAMETQATVLLNEPAAKPAGPAPPAPAGPPSGAATPAGPRSAMETQATVILDRTSPAVAGQASVPPHRRARPTAARLETWRIALRTGLGLAALVLLLLALVMGRHRNATQGSPIDGDPRKTAESFLPKGRILLRPFSKTGPRPKSRRIELDGQPIPNEAEGIALEPGVHQVTWWIGNHRCSRKNIMVEAGKPVFIERQRPCRVQEPDMNSSPQGKGRTVP